ncbi:MAG: prephenate dehydrogenase/arogenate dehydrogenase family protein, partial [Leptospiraceae bacterium]|nr:prephenate dehydrogenase/arogenate dehydrogenase family protein [Leptospiraceae bacterium]
AADHDEVLAYLSHSPHILASLLVNWALENEKVNNYIATVPFPLVGGGFKDMSRIAGSNPEMWEAIIKTNSHFILQSLVQYKEELEKLIQVLKSPKTSENFWKTYFEESKWNRSKILKLDHELNKHSN